MSHKIVKRYAAILILALGSGFIPAGCGGSGSKEQVTVTIKPGGGGPTGQSGFFMLPTGGEVTFKAEVLGTLNKEVTWKVINGSGEITPDFPDSSKATYRAPDALPFLPSDFIEARSVDDPSAVENATVTLTQFNDPLSQSLSSTDTDEVILGALQINPSLAIDLNGDGLNDLVTRNSSQGKITFLLGLQPGFLLKPVVISNPVAMVVGDFINDLVGFIADIAAIRSSPSNDIVFISGAPASPILFSPGFDPETAIPITLGEGTPKLLAAGKFHESTPAIPNAPTSDLAVGTAGGNIVILLQNRNKPVPVSFTRSASPLSVEGTPTQLLSGDFNGDGLDDLAVVLDGQSNLLIFTANSTGDFSGPLTVTSPSPIKSLVAADFNGDQIADLVAAHNTPSPQLSVLLGNGDGTFKKTGTISLISAPGTMAVGDFNFGGAADVAVALPDLKSILILFGDGTGQFIGKWQSPTTATPPLSLVAGCFTGTCANTGTQNFGLIYINPSIPTDQLFLLNNSIGPNNLS